MICPKCGAKLVSGTKYCPICGARQKIQPVSASGQKSGRTGSDYQDYYTEADDYGRSGSRIRRADEDDLYGGSSGAAYSAGRRTRRQSSRQDDYDGDYDTGDNGYQDAGDDDSSYGNADGYDDGGYSDDSDGGYPEDGDAGNEPDDSYAPDDDAGYDGADDGYYDDADDGKKHRNPLIIVIIIAAVVAAVLLVLVLSLMNRNSSSPNVPERLSVTASSSTAATTAASQKAEETLEEESTGTDGETITANGNVYERNEDGVTLVEWNGTGETAILPEEIGGYKLTEIGVHAFSQATDVRYLQLSDSVIRMDTYSVYDLKNLQVIYIPSSVTQIMTYAFSRVETVVTPKGSFAATYMPGKYPQVKIVYGSSLEDAPAVTTTAVAPVRSSQASNNSGNSQNAAAQSAAAAASQSAAESAAAASRSAAESAAASQAAQSAADASAAASSQAAQSAADASAEASRESSAAQSSADASAEESRKASEASTAESTERSESSAREQIAEAAGVDSSAVTQMIYQSLSEGTPEVAFGLVKTADGQQTLYFNSESNPAQAIVTYPADADVSISTADMGLGTNVVVSDGTTTNIFTSDGSGYGTPLFGPLTGVLDPSTMQLIDGDAGTTGYLTVKDGQYQEYAAAQITKDDVAALSGASDILSQLQAAGYDIDSAAYWHRANDMIQIDFGNGTYVNLSLNPDDASVTWDGSTQSGHVTRAAAEGSVTEIEPGDLPQPETTQTPENQASVSSFPVTEFPQGSSNALFEDFNGDGAQEALGWDVKQQADGYSTAVIYDTNGTEVYTTPVEGASFSMAIADIDASAPGLNIVIYAQGGPSGNALLVLNADYSTVLSLTAGTPVLQNTGTFSGISTSSGLIQNANGDGSFTVVLTNPIAGVSSASSWGVPVTFTGGTEVTASEYPLADLSGAGTFAAVRDLTAGSTAGAADVPIAAGTGITPSGITVSGSAWLHLSAPADCYVPIDGSAEIY